MTTALDIAPFELLNKIEQYKHIIEFHRKPWEVNTKRPGITQ